MRPVAVPLNMKDHLHLNLRNPHAKPLYLHFGLRENIKNMKKAKRIGPNKQTRSYECYQKPESHWKDTRGTREFDCIIQTFNPLFVQLARYNLSLSSHERSKVHGFVPWGWTCIKNLHKKWVISIFRVCNVYALEKCLLFVVRTFQLLGLLSSIYSYRFVNSFPNINISKKSVSNYLPSWFGIQGCCHHRACLSLLKQITAT